MTDFRRGRSGATRWIKASLCLALLLALATASGCRSEKDKADERAAIAQMKADIDALGEQTRGDSAAAIEKFEVGPAAGDEAGRMHQVMRQFLNQILDVRNDYLAELDALGWDGILDAERLKADTGMADSRRMLTQARAAMVRAESQTIAVYDAFPELVARSPLKPASRRDVLEGFNGAKSRALADLRGSFALEAETLDEFEAMVDLLGRVEWEVEQSQIMFYSDADVDTFNAHFNRINALVEQLQARQQASLERARESLPGAGS